MAELLERFGLPIILSILSGGGIGWVTVKILMRQMNAKAALDEAGSDKTKAEAGDVIVGSAERLVGVMEKHFEAERGRWQGAIAEIEKKLDTERTARRKDADECKAAINAVGQQKDKQISLLQTEVTVLQNQIRNLKGQNKQLRDRVTELEKKPTGELNTPPPHTIPADPTPPLPTRSDFQDRPSAHPPDDAE